MKTPQDFLKAIGRDAEKKLPIDSWEEFWNLSGPTLKEKNIAVRDRRYVCAPEDFKRIDAQIRHNQLHSVVYGEISARA